MARSNHSPSGNPGANPNGSPPAAPPPPPPPSAPAGPTGSAGCTVSEGSMPTLQRYASDLQSRYDGVSTQLASQKLAFNALGMLGMPMVAAVNSSGDKSVDKAKHAAETMG